MTAQQYAMSFSTGGLFHWESVRFATLFREFGDWEVVRKKIITENLLQARTISSSKRVSREIISRLKTLSTREINYLVEANDQDQAYLLWIAICRRYKFIAEFAIEVLRERYIALKADLNYSDFDFYFNKKSEWHPELDKIKPATRKKLRQVLFKILHEADLLTENNMINAAMPSSRLVGVLDYGNREEVLFLPFFEADLKGIAK